MRRLLALAAVAVLLGCQPKVLILTVQPSAAGTGPAKVKINWKLSAGTGELSADQPVLPKLVPPQPVDAEGELEFEVCKTTTFKLEPHYGGQRTVTVTVAKPCGQCSSPVLTFTGTCQSAGQGPLYTMQTVSAGAVTGNLIDLQSDASFPVHVQHANQDIALSAFGGPLFPLPVVPAAGDYNIYVPGQAGLQICADATSPVGGGPADAPVVHLTVVPACAKP